MGLGNDRATRRSVVIFSPGISKVSPHVFSFKDPTRLTGSTRIVSPTDGRLAIFSKNERNLGLPIGRSRSSDLRGDDLPASAAYAANLYAPGSGMERRLCRPVSA